MTAEPAGEAPSRILCIEDEPAIRSALVRVLRQAGYAVEAAADGRAGLAAISASPPDLVLCDITMPGLSGFQVLETVRQDMPALAGLPFVFLSALADRTDIVAGKRLGADDYIGKPVDFDVLIATVEARLRQVRRIALQAEGERDRIRRAFLTIVPHELRTPLNAIIGYSELLCDEATIPEDGPGREFARMIHANATRLLLLINDVLDLSSLEGEGIALREGRVDLATLIGEVTSVLAVELRQAGLALSVDISPSGLALQADARLVRQMLLHLVSNAVKFSPAGGAVAINAACDRAGAVRLAVADHGIGMAANRVEQLLAPFEQGEMGRDRRFGGLGVGLPLARAFAELHGAHFAIDSAPGQGTTVTVTFPPGRVLSGPRPKREMG